MELAFTFAKLKASSSNIQDRKQCIIDRYGRDSSFIQKIKDPAIRL